MYQYSYCSPLGKMTMAGNEQGLSGLWFDGQKYFGAEVLKECLEKETKVFQMTKKWLDLYFQGKCPDFMPPLKLEGSTFQKKVWKILQEIPYGEIMTYGEIAKKIAQEENRHSMSAQAVGGAVGHNPISILIPCHRVIGANGNLTGYAGGVEKKKALLCLEGWKLSERESFTDNKTSKEKKIEFYVKKADESRKICYNKDKF